MNITRRTASALALSLLFKDGSVLAQGQQSIRVAGNFALEHSSSRAMELFKTEAEKLSEGGLRVDVFPAQQLGGAAENVQAVRNGTIDLIWVGMAFLTRTVPELEAVSLPFQFATRQAAFAMVDGPVGTALDQRLGTRNLLSMGYMELGFRHVTNSQRPIKALEDLRGLRIRLQPNETHLATFRALGANALAMDVRELYSALQQRVVDGQENPFAIINVSRYFEVQKYLSDTGHFFDFISVVANRRSFERLTPKNQNAVRQGMATAIAFQRNLAAEQDATAQAELVAKGMQFDPVSPALARDMRNAVADVARDARRRVGDELAMLVDRELAKLSQ